MNKIWIILSLTFFQTLSANDFYLKIGTGASIPQKTIIDAPPVVWDPALQGYNSNLGTRALYNVGIGYEFPCIFSIEAAVYYRPGFQYRKNQTAVDNGTVINFLGNKTREFDLDILTGMVNFYVSGKGLSYFQWNFGNLCLYPVLGVGIGGTQLNIHNFLSSNIGDITYKCGDNQECGSFPDPECSTTKTFASDNPYTERFQFAYQLMAGLETRICDSCSLLLGYRWFDVGVFKGPRFIRNKCGFGSDVQNNEWRINFKTHEVFLELKVYL